MGILAGCSWATRSGSRVFGTVVGMEGDGRGPVGIRWLVSNSTAGDGQGSAASAMWSRARIKCMPHGEAHVCGTIIPQTTINRAPPPGRLVEASISRKLIVAWRVLRMEYSAENTLATSTRSNRGCGLVGFEATRVDVQGRASATSIK